MKNSKTQKSSEIISGNIPLPWVFQQYPMEGSAINFMEKQENGILTIAEALREGIIE
ncbi:MAG TPA: hypothetical protein GXZ32_04190 [Clostridiales bacterium]|nr:hypothetical protein [Clostridiales bacterium]